MNILIDDMDFSVVNTISNYTNEFINNLFGDEEPKKQLTPTCKKWRKLTRKLLAKAKEEERELLSLFSKKIEVTND